MPDNFTQLAALRDQRIETRLEALLDAAVSEIAQDEDVPRETVASALLSVAVMIYGEHMQCGPEEITAVCSRVSDDLFGDSA